MIYLDNSATTHVDEDILEAMLPWMRGSFGNASSIYAAGRTARLAIEDARLEIATLLGAHPAELIFTSGGTEANNAILKSCCIESALADRLRYGATEHHAVIYPAEWLATQGVDAKPLSVDQSGVIEMSELDGLNDPRTLVSIMSVNNETGVIQPLDKIRGMLPDVLLHTDAVQAVGKVPFDFTGLGLDLATICAHKIHGPKGVGAMFIKRGIDFKEHQHGGGQERNRRAGTEPVALIVGFSVAVRKAVANLEANAEHMRGLQAQTIEAIVAQIPDVTINTDPTLSGPHVVNVSFRDADQLDGEAVLQTMDMRGVAVSNGSACVSGSLQPSHVLQAMGRSVSESKAAVRFSFSKESTSQDVTTAVTILSEVIRNLRVTTRK